MFYKMHCFLKRQASIRSHLLSHLRHFRNFHDKVLMKLHQIYFAIYIV